MNSANDSDPRRKRILWLKSGPLHPLDTGGKKRTYNMLRELHARHEVTFLALLPDGTPSGVTEAAGEYSQHQEWVPWRDKGRGKLGLGLRLAANLFSGQAYVLTKYRSAAMAKKVLELDASGEFDLVVCDFLTPAINLPTGAGMQTPCVLFQHNMEAQIWERLAAGKSNPVSRWYFGKQAARMARWEDRLSRQFDGVIAVSEEDAKYARDVYGLSNVLGAVPTGVDFDYFADPSRAARSADPVRPVVGFLGSMDWMPNIEAVHYFVDAVLPEMRQRIPELQFLVIGRNPPSDIRALAGDDPRIEVTGTVDDVRPQLARCDLLAVPLLSGGGTRIKIMEAVAAGLPVVSTSVGAEGLGLRPGRDIAIADEAAGFAEASVELCLDEKGRGEMAASALAAIRDSSSWENCTQCFLDHCTQVMR